MLNLPTIETTHHPGRSVLLQRRLDSKAKPIGSLGRLEPLALQLGLIQRAGLSELLRLKQAQLVIFAADHGIADEGMAQPSQASTEQMMVALLSGGSAVCALARQHRVPVSVVDAGVSVPLPDHPMLVKRKIAHGTRDACLAAAMSEEQTVAAVHAGMDVVAGLPGNVVLLGEIGVANYASACMLAVRLGNIDIEDILNAGSGVDRAAAGTRRKVLNTALQRHRACETPLDILAAHGGFEIAMLVGAIVQAASERRVVLIDSFVGGAAALVAKALKPAVMDYLVFCQCSAEPGHRLLLDHLEVTPLLDIGLRLGEGTGALLAWPLVMSAAAFFNEMSAADPTKTAGFTPSQSAALTPNPS